MSSNRPRLMLVEDDPQLGPLIARVLDEVYDVSLYTDGRRSTQGRPDRTFRGDGH